MANKAVVLTGKFSSRKFVAIWMPAVVGIVAGVLATFAGMEPEVAYDKAVQVGEVIAYVAMVYIGAEGAGDMVAKLRKK